MRMGGIAILDSLTVSFNDCTWLLNKFQFVGLFSKNLNITYYS